MAVIAEGTRRLLGSLFELKELGPGDLNAIAGAVIAWAALRPAAVKRRFEVLHAGGLTALLGRGGLWPSALDAITNDVGLGPA